MRPVPFRVPTAEPAREAGSDASAGDWGERAGRLYTDLERPARAMVRRAFRGAFSDDELDDIYASAWVGTLRTLARRHRELSDEEVRKYLLTAVANQASKELRRRRRKPTAPLELVDAVADDASAPDERAVGAERSRVARDLLTSLPPRRRAVMLLRYGWGLEPRQVCELIGDLTPRMYRKEVTRGVDELVDRMGRFERGDWCTDREPVLKAYASGLADADQRRQAEAHLSHCNECSDFVARLGGHLHDLGAGLAIPAALDAVDGEMSLGDRVADLGERGRDAVGGLLPRGGAEGVQETAANLTAAGGTRGVAGTAGAGLLAKLTGIGTAGKVAVACLTGGAAATACLSAGVVPGVGVSDDGGDRKQLAPREPGGSTSAPRRTAASDPADRKPTPPPDESPEPPPEPPPSGDAEPPPPPAPPEPVEPIAPSAPASEQQFGVAAAAPEGGGSASGTGGGGGGGGPSEFDREFGGP